MYCVWQVVKTATIISNSPVFKCRLHQIRQRYRFIYRRLWTWCCALYPLLNYGKIYYVVWQFLSLFKVGAEVDRCRPNWRLFSASFVLLLLHRVKIVLEDESYRRPIHDATSPEVLKWHSFCPKSRHKVYIPVCFICSRLPPSLWP